MSELFYLFLKKAKKSDSEVNKNVYQIVRYPSGVEYELSETKSLEEFQVLWDKLDDIMANEDIPVVYRLRSFFYLKKIREVVEDDDSAFEKNFEKQLNNFFDEIAKKGRKS